MTLREALTHTAQHTDPALDEEPPTGGATHVMIMVTPGGYSWAAVTLTGDDLQMKLTDFVPRITTPMTAGLLEAAKQQAASAPTPASPSDLELSLDWPAPTERKH